LLYYQFAMTTTDSLKPSARRYKSAQFLAMAQAMCAGLARKARLGLSDEALRQEMLARFMKNAKK